MKKGMKTKKLAYYAVLVALAMIISYIERLIPFNLAIPGIKLGLANVVVLVAMYLMGTKDALYISVVRILLSGLTFTGFGTMLYALSGGLLSFLIMFMMKKVNRFSILGVSVAGGIGHNIGQILMACLIISNMKLMYYLPVLLIAGVITGILIGIISRLVISHLKKDFTD